MNKRDHEDAALANKEMYNLAVVVKKPVTKKSRAKPSIFSASYGKLYEKLMADAYNHAVKFTPIPEVLDIGAGEGLATLQFLKLGAKVAAVDISDSQLQKLNEQCVDYGDRLEVYCQEVLDAINMFKAKKKKFDVIVAFSFLHHIPNYLNMIKQSAEVLSPGGQFLTFADPLRYNSVGLFTRFFDQFAYYSWRIFRGDVLNGIKRYSRRKRGIYLEDCIEDNLEYHCLRGGVDQDAINELFNKIGFECKIVRYYGTFRPFWQFIGSTLGIKNLFAVIAQKK